MSNLSQTQLALVNRGLHEFLIYKKSTQYQKQSVKVSTGIHRTSNIQVNGKYQYTSVPLRHMPSSYLELIKGKRAITVPLSSFMKPKLPNVHKVLSPLYVLLIIFGGVLTANLGAISTAIGFYKFLGNLGVVLTILGAVVYLHYTYRKL